MDDTSEQMTVTAPAPVQKAGSEHSISARELEDKGANDFGSIMRYEPLISATGASGGSGNGKSGFDRGGYTGYNIRGMESNRVGIDVDGIAQPNATGRGYVGRAGLNTFGIGRDYIDPYMYGSVDIQSGATSTETANSAIGGMSPSARNQRMITCVRARPAPSATAAVTTLRIAAGTTG
ncbi:TonB-dependent receptor plug domain-containing protein [Klebsiella pneumoniae]